MEYIYFLKRDGEKILNTNSYKVGKTSDFKQRMKASEYRNCDILLIRAVNDCDKCEKELLKTMSREFKKSSEVYINREYGDEDFYIENLSQGYKIINDVCDKFIIKYEDQSEEDQSEEDQSEEDQSDEDQSIKIKSSKDQNDEVKSSMIKSSKVKSSKDQNDEVKCNTVKNNRVEDNKVKNSKDQNDEVKCNKVKSSRVKSSRVKSSKDQSDAIKNNEDQTNAIKNDKDQSDEYQDDEYSTSIIQQQFFDLSNLKQYSERSVIDSIIDNTFDVTKLVRQSSSKEPLETNQVIDLLLSNNLIYYSKKTYRYYLNCSIKIFIKILSNVENIYYNYGAEIDTLLDDGSHTIQFTKEQQFIIRTCDAFYKKYNRIPEMNEVFNGVKIGYIFYGKLFDPNYIFVKLIVERIFKYNIRLIQSLHYPKIYALCNEFYKEFKRLPMKKEVYRCYSLGKIVHYRYINREVKEEFKRIFNVDSLR